MKYFVVFLLLVAPLSSVGLAAKGDAEKTQATFAVH